MKKKTKNYYRIITESLPQAPDFARHSLGYLTVFMAVASILLVLYISFLFLHFMQIKEKRLQAQDSLSYWESVVRKHPNFTDGYYNAGYYSFVLGEKVKAIEYLDRALVLDPGFTEAKKLEELVRQ